jgi:hypothetical protein
MLERQRCRVLTTVQIIVFNPVKLRHPQKEEPTHSLALSPVILASSWALSCCRFENERVHPFLLAAVFASSWLTPTRRSLTRNTQKIVRYKLKWNSMPSSLQKLPALPVDHSVVDPSSSVQRVEHWKYHPNANSGQINVKYHSFQKLLQPERKNNSHYRYAYARADYLTKPVCYDILKLLRPMV